MLLLASLVLWTSEVKLRAQDKPNGSTVRGVVKCGDFQIRNEYFEKNADKFLRITDRR